MTSPKTDREKLLVLQSKFEDLSKDLLAAENENIRLNAEGLANSARNDQYPGKSLLTHALETIKMLTAIIVVLVTYKYGIKG